MVATPACYHTTTSSVIARYASRRSSSSARSSASTLARSSATIFNGATDYAIVTYVPSNQQTLATFAEDGWQA
jgi:hypothetical protein